MTRRHDEDTSHPSSAEERRLGSCRRALQRDWQGGGGQLQRRPSDLLERGREERGSSDEMRWSAGPQDGLGGFSWLRGVPSLVPMLITEKRRHLTKRKARRR